MPPDALGRGVHGLGAAYHQAALRVERLHYAPTHCDILFFEPLTVEDVLNICDRVQPDGVIVQFGGQTPLNLARALALAGVPIIGTSVDTIDAAEDRKKFQQHAQRSRHLPTIRCSPPPSCGVG